MRLYGAPVEVQYIRETIGRLSSSHIQLQESNGDVGGVLNAMEQSESRIGSASYDTAHKMPEVRLTADYASLTNADCGCRTSSVYLVSRPRRGLASVPDRHWRDRTVRGGGTYCSGYVGCGV